MRETAVRTQRFRAAFADALRRAVERFPSHAAAAKDLGISKQRLQQYLDGAATPHADFFVWAMTKWSLRMRPYGSEVLVREARSPARERPGQLALFDSPRLLSGGRISVKKGPAKGTLTLRLDVRSAG